MLFPLSAANDNFRFLRRMTNNLEKYRKTMSKMKVKIKCVFHIIRKITHFHHNFLRLVLLLKLIWEICVNRYFVGLTQYVHNLDVLVEAIRFIRYQDTFGWFPTKAMGELDIWRAMTGRPVSRVNTRNILKTGWRLLSRSICIFMTSLENKNENWPK